MKKLIAAFLAIASLMPLLAYRDLETGAFLTHDPAGFVDGPNVYTYVSQNPWTHFDPEGLFPDNTLSIYSGMDRQQAVEVGTNAAKETAAVLPFALVGGVEGIPATVGLLGRASYIGAQTGGAGAMSSAISSAVNGKAPSISNMNSTGAVSASLGAASSIAGDVTAALTAPKLSLDVNQPTVQASTPYGELAPTLQGTGKQANHLNQTAIYGGYIPKDQGLSYPLQGDAITGAGGTEHFGYHDISESYLDEYRPKGSMFPAKPTNDELLDATMDANIRGAGIPESTALQLRNEAAAEQKAAGLNGSDPIPVVPSRLNQKAPVEPNAPPAKPTTVTGS